MNMAVDQALMETAAEPVLRVYAWDQPSVSFGYSGIHEKLRAAFPPWPAVRRWTGGGVVLHDDEDTTYSLVVPAGDAWSRTRPLESYKLIHESLAALLDECRLAGEAERLDGPRCFEAPALFDLLRGGEKIAGAGQRRCRHGLLHQGSIRLALGEDFWWRWARSVADEVRKVSGLGETVLARAQDLVGERYGTTAWLERREQGGA